MYDEINEDDNFCTNDKNPKSLYIIAIVFAIIFMIITVVYKIFFSPESLHKITIVNNCSYDIDLLFGAQHDSKKNIVYFPPNTIKSRSTVNYKATPGAVITVKGYKFGYSVTDINPFTTVNLSLSNYNFYGKTKIIDNNNNTITDIYTNDNETDYDYYDVSIQDGYNIPFTIYPTSNFDSATGNYCSGPIWKEITVCPEVLQGPNTGPNYQYCKTPCYADLESTIDKQNFCCNLLGSCTIPDQCENSWRAYYNVFANACPNCLITNCDKTNYFCKSVNGLSNYTLTFCPNLLK
jgi:hypothetical protein